MAINLNVTQTQYDQMMVVLHGIRAKLAANKAELTRALAMENGQTKLAAFAVSQTPPWLREVKRARDDLNTFFTEIGWRD